MGANMESTVFATLTPVSTLTKWAMGIIGYELTYGCHPFKFLANPWREGKEHEKMRSEFQKSYDQATGLRVNSVQGKRPNHRPCRRGF
jgi:hypothetical protein